MGYNAFFRGVNSTLRGIERESKRIQKENEKKRKYLNKMAVLERAKFEVEEYENYIELIRSIHKDCNFPVDWTEMQNLPEPKKPDMSNLREKEAILKREIYSPSFIDKLLNLQNKRIRDLEGNILKAISIDEKENQYSLNEYKKEYEDWRKSTETASKVLSGNKEAYYEVIKEMAPFEEIESIGSSIGFGFINKEFIASELKIHKDTVIPKTEKSLLKSGKLSLKEIPISKINTIYQDYVCSAVLRVARELFALLPVEKILINAIVEMVNKQTGNSDEVVVLSVFIPRKTVSTLNFDMVDPSDCMNNFVHNMNFKKSIGFSKVSEIDYKRYA